MSRHPTIVLEGSERSVAYGRVWPEVKSDVAIELECARDNWLPDSGGLGAYGHLRNASEILWPSMKPSYHEWTRDRWQAFTERNAKGDFHQVVALAGGSGVAKSADVARYALLWWWQNPAHRAVIVCSTTLNALKKRIWAYIAKYRYMEGGNDMPGLLSNADPPKCMFAKRDPMHGIFSAALKEGNAEKTLADLIGIHPDDGLLVIVDEATDVTPAVEQAIVNWSSGVPFFQMIVLGNSKSKSDVHGKFCTPLLGWQSVNPDRDERWVTKHGICLFHDCYRSPAVLHPEMAGKGKPLYFLWDSAKIKEKEEKWGKDSPLFWRFVRGFWPPEDMERTVLTQNMITKHRSKSRAQWDGSFKLTLAGLDPAFTSEGDACILRFADFGVMQNGLWGLDFGGPENVVQIKLKNDDLVFYQIVKQARRECERRGVSPQHLAVDTWGFGAGAGDIFQKEWSPLVYRVNSIGAPTTRRVDAEIADTAYDLYDRRATELIWLIREFVQANQIFGLDDVTCEQLCARLWNWKGRKIYVETKKDFKFRMGKATEAGGSPDEMDGAALIVDLARELGMRVSAVATEEEVTSMGGNSRYMAAASADPFFKERAARRRLTGEEPNSLANHPGMRDAWEGTFSVDRPPDQDTAFSFYTS